MTTPSFFYIPEPKPKATRRFFAFHHAGGAGANYLKIKTHLPEDCELVLAELPGRGRLTSLPPFTNWTELTRTLTEAIAPLHDRPSVFFGHSLGGLVAYEILVRRAAAAPKTLLAVSAINAPSHLIRTPFDSESPPTDADLIARIRDTGGAPREVIEIPGLIERYLPILRTDLDLLKHYPAPQTGRAPLAGPIAAYQPTQDPWITAEGMARWADFTGGSFLLQFREGIHFYLFEQFSSLIPHICAQAVFP